MERLYGMTVLGGSSAVLGEQAMVLFFPLIQLSSTYTKLKILIKTMEPIPIQHLLRYQIVGEML